VPPTTERIVEEPDDEVIIKPRDRAGIRDLPASSALGLPPPPLPPEPSNEPLALPGSFAQPGTPAAVPFRTPAFTQARVIGPTGPGAPIFGGTPGFGGFEQPIGDDEEQLIRRIVAGLPTRR
jgi:hypothetical protein